MNENILLKMNHIRKEFPGVLALKDVSFELRAGEVHALLGENGAGKSTLIKILGGIYSSDAGEIVINGKVATIDKVQDAQSHGISVIHQELVLVPHMTVAENIYLGREPIKKGSRFVDFKQMNRDAK
ncbi:MAG: ATP-binding cassette domain-containing protein, partial [Sphaerochaetaceae bacterium]